MDYDCLFRPFLSSPARIQLAGALRLCRLLRPIAYANAAFRIAIAEEPAGSRDTTKLEPNQLLNAPLRTSLRILAFTLVSTSINSGGAFYYICVKIAATSSGGKRL